MSKTRSSARTLASMVRDSDRHVGMRKIHEPRPAPRRQGTRSAIVAAELKASR